MDSDRRYQVFVSSTFLDLKEPRQAVVSTLLELDAFPAGMELFPATDSDAWSLIADVIADSDYYLLIIGGKYGSVDPDLAISYTEREYDTAVELGKPVMAFLHGEPGKLLAEQIEQSPARRKKLVAFRTKVEKAKHVKYWSNADDLAGKVAKSWGPFRKRHPATGWIRADQASARESLTALARAQAEVDRLRQELERARTQAPAGTEVLAQGDSNFTLPIKLTGRWRYPNEYQWNSIYRWAEVDCTWDRVFGYLGLRMMQEADNKALQDDLSRVVTADNLDALNDWFKVAAKEAAGVQSDEEVEGKFVQVDVDDEDYQTILLQLDALGLIQHSQRARSVKDTSNYWSLTPYGRTRLRQIRAIKSGNSVLSRDTDLALEPNDSDTESDQSAK